MKGNVIFYRGSGKVGNMVGYVKGGVQMFRAKAETVFNPQTARQELSRAKLSLASDLARGLANVLRVTYHTEANNRVSARNIFLGKIIPVDADCIHGTTPSTITFNYEVMPVATGTRSNIGWDEPDLDDPLTVKLGISEVNFNDPNLINGADGTPRYVYAMGIVYCPEMHGSVYGTVKVYDPGDPSHTAPNKIEVVVPSLWQGKRIYMYGVVCQSPLALNGIAAGTEPTRLPIETSNSHYLGTGYIA